MFVRASSLPASSCGWAMHARMSVENAVAGIGRPWLSTCCSPSMRGMSPSQITYAWSMRCTSSRSHSGTATICILPLSSRPRSYTDQFTVRASDGLMRYCTAIMMIALQSCLSLTSTTTPVSRAFMRASAAARIGSVYPGVWSTFAIMLRLPACMLWGLSAICVCRMSSTLAGLAKLGERHRSMGRIVSGSRSIKMWLYTFPGRPVESAPALAA